MKDVYPGISAHVGDRPEEGHATDANTLLFFAAEWGHSKFLPPQSLVAWAKTMVPSQLRFRPNH